MSGLFDTLICWLIWLAKTGIWVIVSALNLILKVLADLANLAISALPDAAVERPSIDGGVVATMNYFLPVGPLAAAALVLIAAWGAYRLYRYVFRWVL